MTENEKLVRDETEAIECLKSNKPTSGYLMLQESIDMAIKALEEIQKYRKIGTVEECRAAVESQNPRAAITEKEDNGIKKYTCSACGRYMGWSTGTLPARYCWKCGQKLDWSDEE